MKAPVEAATQPGTVGPILEVMLLERCRRGRENWTTAPGLQRRRFRHGPGLPEPLHHLQPDGEILLLFHHFAAHLRHVKQIQVVAAEEQDAERNDQQKGDRFFALDLHRAGLVRISLFGSRVEAMKRLVANTRISRPLSPRRQRRRQESIACGPQTFEQSGFSPTTILHSTFHRHLN
uniref:Uncharacterized protein n=1 Tax=Anopheles quadriannulatus TaxID=34691 RepID=A0A182XSZ5_ANOQN